MYSKQQAGKQCKRANVLLRRRCFSSYTTTISSQIQSGSETEVKRKNNFKPSKKDLYYKAKERNK
jgi:hypothetical protein